VTETGGSGPTVLTERIGIYGVLALVIGNAISIPIFVLPGALGQEAGPSVLLAAVAAAIPASFVVLYNAQLGSAMPVAGGLYVYISRLTAPYWGFLVPWTLPIVNWAALVFTAIGFADYVQFFVDLPTDPLIYGFLLFVLAINLLGIDLVAKAQIAFVIALFLSVFTFIVPGAFAVDPGNYTPFFPEGYGPFAIAAVALYYPYLGFGLLTEIGEEIDDPGRVIPLALFSGVVIVAVIYLALIAVLVGVVPYEQLTDQAAVARAATRFLPGPLATFVGLGAIFAVATSVNTSLLVSSRTIMRAGRDGILPESLSRIHPRFGTPYVSILALGVPPLVVAAFIDREIVALSAFIALAVLTAAFFSAIALWNLPREFPKHYENAPFQFRRHRGLLVAVLGGAISSAVLWSITLSQLPVAGLILVGWFTLGYGYYRYRIAAADVAGGDLYVKMVSLERHEEAFAERGTYEGVEDDIDEVSGAGEDD